MTRHLDSLEEAAGVLKQAERILVIGCSGGGKSTLSRGICGRLGIPYISMDRDFFWLPGWVKREKAEERALIAEGVARERWLMDGSGSSSFDIRLPRAQMVVWVRLPRWRCLLGVTRRALHYLGKTRPDMAPGCVERIPDREFLSYIWHFEKHFVPHILSQLQRYGAGVPVLQLKSHAEMCDLLDLLDTPA
ncbi:MULTISPECIES: AAA family ATPase [unclassified Rhizobium]|uniref:AAA family ATPase n=1 Tax=unclassified Rhizobium TaxID=2613769 RepID=UPI0006FECBF9|nr:MULTISPECIES: AAA family ATPase [unclassified Rhizobium]KQV42498.1 AAA family ATPase [Rhizobium sp. Root1212]KRD21471.1 AAA family ATPase [Rhizobium sp. Root268]